MKKAIVLLACLLMSVCAFGDYTIFVPLPTTQAFDHAFVHITVPTEIGIALSPAELLGCESSAGRTTRHYRIESAATLTMHTESDNPLDIPAPDIAIDYASAPQDANCDGRVNILDLIYIRNRLGSDVSTNRNAAADVNRDGKVDVLDLLVVRNAL